MGKLKVGIIDILGKSATRKAWSRFIRANNTSIMPQVVAVWCEELGHDVSMVYYNGPEIMAGGIPDDVDIIFINAFSQNAMLAYALSNYFRSKGAVTVLGGPHARSYPDDSIKYFDYAVGFCDKTLLGDILQDCAQHRPLGQFLSTVRQPPSIPGVTERWKFMQSIMAEAKLLKTIPMIGSLGCPYTCSFCIDALVPYQPLDFDAMKEDLLFVLKNKSPRTIVIWHDPNFGVQFNNYLDVIEAAVPPGRITFLAEMTFSLLNEDHCRRLKRNGFKVLLPGIESWYDIGDKSKLRSTTGMEKVRRIAEQARMIISYIPYLQGNLIVGLDADQGPDPFELSKRFLELVPGVYPLFSLLTSYGRNAPDNLRYQREGRVLNIPFHFLNQTHASNVRPKNYTWPELFAYTTDLLEVTFSHSANWRRFKAVKHTSSRLEQLLRGVSSGRGHKYKNMRLLRDRVDDPQVRRYFEGETMELPRFYVDPIREDLGWLWDWLPEGAIYHDPYAYLKSFNGEAQTEPLIHAGMATA